MKRVCVRIPEDRVEDLKKAAEDMRNESAKTRTPGWDSKLIAKIAQEKFGGYAEMFDHLNWPERGTKMVPAVQSRVKEKFGSVEAFAEFYGYGV
jgi:hypothetical protein